MTAFFKNFLPFGRKALLLAVVGVLFAQLLLYLGVGAEAALYTDTLFWVGMTFFVTGLVSLVHNMGAFNGLIYGTKCGIAILKRRQKNSREMIDGFVDFSNSRRRFNDVPQKMTCAVLFFTLSVLSFVL